MSGHRLHGPFDECGTCDDMEDAGVDALTRMNAHAAAVRMDNLVRNLEIPYPTRRTAPTPVTSWPARAYCYGTWGYALGQARALSSQRGLRTHLYRTDLDGDAVWVVSWDPKRGGAS